jgi:hypothetical protein
LHDKEQKKLYLKNKTIPPESIIVSNVPHNLAMQRNWIKENLVKPKDKWFILMDDNIRGFAVVPKKFYRHDNIPILHGEDARQADGRSRVRNFSQIEDLVQDNVEYADELGAGLIGFGNHPNYFFRRKKFKTITVICQKFCIVRNDDLRWIKNTKQQNDSAYSALALIKYGRVLLNNFIYPISKHYEPGGLGDLDVRRKKRKVGAAILMRRFPGLFKFVKYKETSWFYGYSNLEINIHSEKKFLEWRKEYLKQRDEDDV